MSDTAGIIILVGRVIFVIFPALISGYGFHLKHPKAAEGYAGSVGFPATGLAGIPAGLWLEVSCLSIALGVWADIGSLMLAAFVLVAAFYFHRYWAVTDADQRQTQTQLFYRNVTTFAACLVMFGFFAGVGDALPYTITGPLIDLT